MSILSRGMQHDTVGTYTTLEAMLTACNSSPANLQGRVREYVHLGGKRLCGYGGGAAGATGDGSDDPDTGDDVDEYSCMYQPGCKKRRLTPEQVKMLEKAFAIHNKLEPDCKMQLARDLNLEPRQVAVWFQNRRARWKTKQLEKDYEALKHTYHSLKTSFEVLLSEKQHLEQEVASLTEKLRPKDETQSRAKQVLNDWKSGLLTEHIDVDEDHEKGSLEEVSASEESAVSEASSPDAVDSAAKENGSSPYAEVGAGTAGFLTASEGALGEKALPVVNQPSSVKLEMEEENEATYTFFLPEADHGSFPWWNATWI